MPELTNPHALNSRGLARGLCFVAPPDAWLSRFSPFRALTADEFRAASRPAYAAQGGVAVIPIRGLMVKTPFWMDEVGTPAVAAAVRAAAADQGVKTIVLMIDSPGGEVGGIAELADAVYAARGQKTVIAQVDGMANSAAYWVASQAGKVYLGRLDMVGSIGVYTWLLDDSKWAEAQGFRVVPLTTGEFKGVGGIPGQEVTEAQVADAQRTVDSYFGAFVADVARGRGLGRAAVQKLATGQVWIGAEAVGLGLADKVLRYSAPAGQSSDSRAQTDSTPAGRLAACRLELAQVELDQAAESAQKSSGKTE